LLIEKEKAFAHFFTSLDCLCIVVVVFFSFFFLISCAMEGGYAQVVESSEPQIYSQNSAWMMSSSSIPQFQTHGPSLKVPSAFQNVGNSFSQSPYVRLPYSDNEVQEVGYQPPSQISSHNQQFLQSSNFLQPPFFSQPKVFRDVGKSVLLEVKKEGESKVVPKKRDRGPTKSKGGEKEAKKSKKFEEKACFEEGEKDDNDESLHWKDEEVETLIAVRGELAQEFSKAAKKQGMCSIYRLQLQYLEILMIFLLSAKCLSKTEVPFGAFAFA
jgi:hypothetical protein